MVTSRHETIEPTAELQDRGFQQLGTNNTVLTGGVTYRRCHLQEVSLKGGVTYRRCHLKEVSLTGGATYRRCHLQEVSLTGGVT